MAPYPILFFVFRSIFCKNVKNCSVTHIRWNFFPFLERCRECFTWISLLQEFTNTFTHMKLSHRTAENLMLKFLILIFSSLLILLCFEVYWNNIGSVVKIVGLGSSISTAQYFFSSKAECYPPINTPTPSIIFTYKRYRFP